MFPCVCPPDTFRAYFKQLREETCKRMFDRVFDSAGAANKYWIAFGKKKFMVWRQSVGWGSV